MDEWDLDNEGENDGKNYATHHQAGEFPGDARASEPEASKAIGDVIVRGQIDGPILLSDRC